MRYFMIISSDKYGETWPRVAFSLPMINIASQWNIAARLWRDESFGVEVEYDIGCFLKRFSINVKKKCKKK